MTTHFKYNNSHIVTGLFFLIGISVIIFTKNSPIADFGNYYYGSKLFTDGKFSLEDYQSLHHFNRQIAAYGATNYFENYTPVPPFSLLFYIPFTFLSCIQAKLLFNILSLLVFCFSFLRLSKRLHLNTQFLFLIPIIFLYPLYSNIYQGQAFLLVTAFLMESYMADEDRKPFVSAFFLALSISLKIFPVFILIYYLLKKSFKTTIYTVLLIGGLQLLTLCFVGLPVISNYFVHVLPRLMNNDIIGAYYFSNQSLYTLLLNLLSYEELQNASPLFNAPWLVPLIESVYVTIVLSVLYSLRKKDSILFFGLTLFSCILAGRYNTSYGMLMLVPFAIGLLSDRHIELKHYIILLILFIAVSMPVVNFINSALLLRYSRLIGLLVVFALLLLYYKPKVHIAIFAVILCLVTTFKYSGFTYNKPVYFEAQNTKGILYDYKIRNDSITLFSTLGDKGHIETVSLKGNSIETERLNISNTSLYYDGIQIYDSPDNKQKPFIYNDSLAVFMSDMNQGFGFYKLRMVPLK